MKTSLELLKRWLPRPGQAVWLLPPLLFVLGFWLGAAVLPATSLSALYAQGRAAIASALPAARFERPPLYPALLHSAGLPRLDSGPAAQAGAGPAAADEPIAAAGVDATPEPPEVILVLTPAQAGLIADADGGEAAANGGLPSPAAATDEPRAVVYCTHTSEEYAGQTRLKGQAGGVLNAARALAAELENQGVAVILDESLHDDDYNSAYAHSLQSLQALAAEHPDIELFIDVHRDSAIAGINTSLAANGADYAKLLLIVGSDQQLSHPDWRDNLDFATRVTATVESALPGLTRGEPRVYSGRYNQHLGSQAILVEIGSTDNTQEQAERSARELARAIAECL